MSGAPNKARLNATDDVARHHTPSAHGPQPHGIRPYQAACMVSLATIHSFTNRRVTTTLCQHPTTWPPSTWQQALPEICSGRVSAEKASSSDE
jgi:hypothetical protein